MLVLIVTKLGFLGLKICSCHVFKTDFYLCGFLFGSASGFVGKEKEGHCLHCSCR